MPLEPDYTPGDLDAATEAFWWRIDLLRSRFYTLASVLSDLATFPHSAVLLARLGELPAEDLQSELAAVLADGERLGELRKRPAQTGGS